jgi:hypothetical protein
MAGPLLPRRAQVGGRPWTLKQVQGDEMERLSRGRVCKRYNPQRKRAAPSGPPFFVQRCRQSLTPPWAALPSPAR